MEFLSTWPCEIRLSKKGSLLSFSKVVNTCLFWKVELTSWEKLKTELTYGWTTNGNFVNTNFTKKRFSSVTIRLQPDLTLPLLTIFDSTISWRLIRSYDNLYHSLR